MGPSPSLYQLYGRSREEGHVSLEDILGLCCEAEREQLLQILSNLLKNAINFTETGSVLLRARYDWERLWIEIAVSDTGIGVPPELPDRLFQRFIQADGSITRRFGGAGPGLSFCRQRTPRWEDQSG
jgi:signal transduction histidine kinase